jgi:hypothetical protein
VVHFNLDAKAQPAAHAVRTANSISAFNFPIETFDWASGQPARWSTF